MTHVLYILMRTDMDSMNPGKAMAQAAHAANAFWFNGRISAVRQWAAQTQQGFGTTIVLDVTEPQLKHIVGKGIELGFAAECILDPTYPVRDGKTTHYIPVVTCGYIFGNKEDWALIHLLDGLELHK